MQCIGDLLESFKVYAVCISCARMELVDLLAMADTLGADTTIDALRKRLRCTGCGVRREDIRIVYVGRCERASAFRYRSR